MIDIRRGVSTAFLALVITFGTANAQPVAPGTCFMVPSFCELRGQTLDTKACKCVGRRSDAPGGGARNSKQ